MKFDSNTLYGFKSPERLHYRGIEEESQQERYIAKYGNGPFRIKYEPYSADVVEIFTPSGEFIDSGFFNWRFEQYFEFVND